MFSANGSGSLNQTKRIMERLVNTPPKPHVKDSSTKSSQKEKPGGPPAKNDRPEEK